MFGCPFAYVLMYTDCESEYLFKKILFYYLSDLKFREPNSPVTIHSRKSGKKSIQLNTKNVIAKPRSAQLLEIVIIIYKYTHDIQVNEH